MCELYRVVFIVILTEVKYVQHYLCYKVYHRDPIKFCNKQLCLFSGQYNIHNLPSDLFISMNYST